MIPTDYKFSSYNKQLIIYNKIYLFDQRWHFPRRLGGSEFKLINLVGLVLDGQVFHVQGVY